MTGTSAAEISARNSLREQIRNLTTKFYSNNLYAAPTRKKIVEDIAVIRDQLLDDYKVSVPMVALYVGEFGARLKVKFLPATLLKGEGCVGWMTENSGDISQLRVENLHGPKN